MKRNSRSLRLLCMSLAIALMVSLVGCGQNEAGSSEGQTSNENASEVVSSKDEMVVACYGAVQSMFPGNDSKLPGAQLHVNLYDTLVTMDKDGTILPLLAESWEQLSDTTYRFHIRKGVKFHNGDELKASDVAFSLATLMETPGAKSNAAQFDAEHFVVEDDYTVVLATLKPFAPFLPTLCHATMSIFQQSFYEEHLAAGDLDLVENGTGPFKLTEWNEGENIVVERFDDYFDGPAKMKTINFRYIPEVSTRLMELEAGGVDLIQEVSGTIMEDIQANPDLTLWTCSGVNTSYLALNFDKIADTKLREAIAHSIDNKTLCSVCLLDAAEPLDNYLPATVPGAYDTGGYAFDPELSKQLLAEAGYPDGYELELSFYTSADNRRMGEFLQNMMAESGITVKLNEMDSSAYTPMLNAREQTAAILTTVCTLRDPHQTLGKLYSDLVGSGGNRVNYVDPELDAMLDEAAEEIDTTKRMELYADIQQYLYDRVVYIPLYNMKTMTATTAKIRGFDLVLPTNYQKYNNVYFVE
ncbi:ABC transporter substrate-binding protein [Oscillibacter hominis]|uniref:ABC transporter substrate-binding protein n=1 Tax=Oscillibacter hominis TaxID=2763056 RepID=A0A7G9B5Z2_9FIRM|nr:ABC transporter substrate-binding protein [Oscillibacter hominis]QNL44973.1 ABC transporter substrate-binding protein [Oscillibacter hominis]